MAKYALGIVLLFATPAAAGETTLPDIGTTVQAPAAAVCTSCAVAPVRQSVLVSTRQRVRQRIVKRPLLRRINWRPWQRVRRARGCGGC